MMLCRMCASMTAFVRLRAKNAFFHLFLPKLRKLHHRRVEFLGERRANTTLLSAHTGTVRPNADFPAYANPCNVFQTKCRNVKEQKHYSKTSLIRIQDFGVTG